MSDGGGMEQVRDLLFGAQVKQIEDRIERQEELLAARIESLANETRARCDLFEAALKENAQAEATKRGETNDRIEERIARLRAELDSSAKALNAALLKAESGLNALIADSNERLFGAISDRHSEALRTIEDLSAALKAELVSKESLSKLFGDLAQNVGG
ncbi:MAG: hypothetical protein LBQ52_00765 [Helicobacteraceae bacterium]|nr:hypothetical protein [Helicobacteraceae bacterium]